jgi:hypothetical protein
MQEGSCLLLYRKIGYATHSSHDHLPIMTQAVVSDHMLYKLFWYDAIILSPSCFAPWYMTLLYTFWCIIWQHRAIIDEYSLMSFSTFCHCNLKVCWAKAQSILIWCCQFYVEIEIVMLSNHCTMKACQNEEGENLWVFQCRPEKTAMLAHEKQYLHGYIIF